MKKKHPELLPDDLVSPKTSSLNSHSVSKSEVTTDSISKADVDVKNLATASSDSLNNTSEQSTTVEGHKDTNHDNSFTKDSTERPTHVVNNSCENEEMREKQSLEKSHKNSELTSENSVKLTDTKHMPSETDISPASIVSTNQNHCNSQSATTSTNDLQEFKEHVKRVKKTDMYEFQSEDESSDEMKPGTVS
jgi:hypothetical protein